MLAQTPMCLFAVPMDARTCHFHRTVGYLENGCRKNLNFKSNDDGDQDNDDDDDGDDDETLRRGCCVKRLTRHMARVPFEGGVVPLTVGVDFAAPLLVHVGRVEWFKVSRYM